MYLAIIQNCIVVYAKFMVKIKIYSYKNYTTKFEIKFCVLKSTRNMDVTESSGVCKFTFNQ